LNSDIVYLIRIKIKLKKKKPKLLVNLIFEKEKKKYTSCKSWFFESIELFEGVITLGLTSLFNSCPFSFTNDLL